ncbi:MAG: fibronectin type III domain-containing protein [Bacteroidales bacterium]|nr:fibronectin type III domain-containing protein [Bacteroidales bacterium]
MKPNQLLNYLITLFLFLFLSCEDENSDTTPPNTIQDLVVIAKNEQVLLQWKNPEDDDLHKIILAFNDTLIEIDPMHESITIKGLTNDTEYTFELYTVDKNGNQSIATTVKATPVHFVTTVNGKEFESGTYEKFGINPSKIIIDGINYDKSWGNDGNSGSMKGTLEKVNDTTYVCKIDYVFNDEHMAYVEQKRNSVLCFELDDTTYFKENAYEKIEGENDKIVGKYQSTFMAYSTDNDNYNDTSYSYLEFKDNKDVEYSSSSGYSKSYKWSSDELNNNNYIFVKLNNRTYLIEKREGLLHIKQ